MRIDRPGIRFGQAAIRVEHNTAISQARHARTQVAELRMTRLVLGLPR